MSLLKASYKQILIIALPLIIGNLAWTSNGVFDTIFVGKLGNTQLEAIGFASVFYSVLFMMGFSFTRGTQLLIARRLGEMNRREVGNILDNTLITLTAVATLLFILIRLNLHSILGLMLDSEPVVNACEEFLSYRMWGLVPSFLSFVFIAFYSGIGQTVILALSVGLMTTLNITLNYGLVYGKFGLPEIGIGGSGMATAISETIAVAVLVGGTFYKSRNKEYSLYKFAKFDTDVLMQMVKISVPLMLQSLAAVGAWLIFFSRIQVKLGNEPLAVSSIYRQLILFFTIPTWSLGSAANTIISNLVGQRDFEGVKLGIRRISVLSFGFALFSAALIYFFPYFFINVFVNEAQGHEVVPMAIEALPVLFGVFLIMAFGNILYNGVISLGDIFVALVIELIVVVLYIGYFMYVLNQPWGNLWWVWTAEWVYWFVMIACSLAYLKYRRIHVV